MRYKKFVADLAFNYGVSKRRQGRRNNMVWVVARSNKGIYMQVGSGHIYTGSLQRTAVHKLFSEVIHIVKTVMGKLIFETIKYGFSVI